MEDENLPFTRKKLDMLSVTDLISKWETAQLTLDVIDGFQNQFQVLNAKKQSSW